MVKKVYATAQEFFAQNEELGLNLPYSEDTSVFATSLTVGKHIIPNRLACQAMEGCDGTADGSPDELTIRRYDRFAAGGAGLIWFEATAVLPEGQANPRQLYIHKGNLDSFKREERIKETGLKTNGFEPMVIMQATHSGRYSKPEGVPAPCLPITTPSSRRTTPSPPTALSPMTIWTRCGMPWWRVPPWPSRPVLTAWISRPATAISIPNCCPPIPAPSTGANTAFPRPV